MNVLGGKYLHCLMVNKYPIVILVSCILGRIDSVTGIRRFTAGGVERSHARCLAAAVNYSGGKSGLIGILKAVSSF